MSLSPDSKPIGLPAGRRLIALALAGCATAIAILWGTTLPLGIPGEWTWDRIPTDPLLPFSAMQLLVAGVIYLAAGVLGDRRFGGAGPWERCAWIAAAATGALLWSATLISLTPAPWNSGRATWVLYYPGPSGYYTEARSTNDPWGYLARYQEKVAEGDVLHIGTHPPGLVMAWWLFDTVRRHGPGVDALLAATQPADAAEWWQLIREQTANAPRPPPTDDGRLLWFGAVTVWLLSLGTALPLGWLVTRWAGPTAGWRTALLWPAVPALAIFWPKSDGLLPFFGITTIALYISAWDRRSPVRAASAGCVAFIGVMLTLGLLPSLFWIGVWTVVQLVMAFRRQGLSHTIGDRTWLVPVTAAIAFVTMTWSSSLLLSMNLPAIWLGNLHNHAAFYDHYPRSYFGWLLVNPVELLFALGLPIGFVALHQIVRSLRGEQSAGAFCSSQDPPGSSPLDGTIARDALDSRRECLDHPQPCQAAVCSRLLRDWLLPTLVTFAVLWLTGKNSGEVARLWQFQLPWWLGLTAMAWRDEHSSRRWLLVWLLQLIACAVTCWRVAGFQVAG